MLVSDFMEALYNHILNYHQEKVIFGHLKYVYSNIHHFEIIQKSPKEFIVQKNCVDV